MKRKPCELRYDYCARRLMDQQETEDLMKSRQLWNSAILVDGPGGRPVKMVQQGTFREKDNGGKAL
jgi:hypothetical protein